MCAFINQKCMKNKLTFIFFGYCLFNCTVYAEQELVNATNQKNVLQKPKVRHLSDKWTILSKDQDLPNSSKKTEIKITNNRNTDDINSQQTENNSEISNNTQADNKQTNELNSLNDNEYYFSPNLANSLFLNEQTIASFNQKQRILPGKYDLNLYLNDKFIKRLNQVEVYNQGANSFACLPDEVLITIGVRPENINATDDICSTLSNRVNGAVMKIDPSNMNLYLTIGQNLLNRNQQNVVDITELDAGSSIGFINYFSNYYHSSNNGYNSKITYDSAYLSLNGGINFGLWQYRQSAYVSHTNNQATIWRNGTRYVQRPIINLQSNLKLGELNTSSNLLGGISFIGADLSSDNRMLPDTKQGYAPQINGIAKTNAKVSVMQNGHEIYQITVAPGAFVIDDLYPNNAQGDLTVIINEADGSTTTFNVPFSSVPQSIRPGNSNYNLSIGQTNLSYITKQANFIDGTYQYGLSNSITVNGGARVSNDYKSLVLGTVYSSRIGAIGTGLTYSNAKLPNVSNMEGYMGHLSYSKTFTPTHTSITLANYRYSSKNYYELSDLLGIKDAIAQGYTFRSHTYQLHSRFDLSVSQSLNMFGHASVYVATSKYRNNLPRDKQFQLSYGNSFKRVGFSINLARQFSDNKQTDKIVSLSLSIPLDGFRTDLSSSYTHSKSSGASHYTNINGVIGDDYATNYAVGVNHVQGQSSSYNASLGHNFNKVNTNFNLSSGKNYWQAGVSANGALAIHDGRITFGPYLSDTFALIEAKNAKGAKVMYYDNIKIDGNGYALLPSVSPYRYSDIGLTSSNTNLNTEIVDGSKKIAPYAGSAIKLTFATKTGYPILIFSTYQNKPLPFGAEVLDEQHNNIGMVGQGGQIYIKASNLAGKLIVKLPKNTSCNINFDIRNSYNPTSFTKLTAECI